MTKSKREEEYAGTTFRMERELKQKFNETLDEMGLNITSAFTLFAKAVVRSGKIPFDVMVDPFYRAENTDEIKRRLADIESGEATLINTTIEELRAKIN